MTKRRYEGYVSTREAATMAQHDRRTIVNWITAGTLPAIRRGPGTRSHYLVRVEDLKKLVPHLEETHEPETRPQPQP